MLRIRYSWQKTTNIAAAVNRRCSFWRTGDHAQPNVRNKRRTGGTSAKDQSAMEATPGIEPGYTVLQTVNWCFRKLLKLTIFPRDVAESSGKKGKVVAVNGNQR